MPAGQVGLGQGDGVSAALALAAGNMIADLSIGGTDASLRQRMVDMTASIRLPERVRLVLSLGVLADGDLAYQGRAFRLETGVRAGVQVVWRALVPDGGVPFIDIGGAFAVAHTNTVNAASNPVEHDEPWTTLDMRASVSLGWSIGGVFNPYVAVRAFGGPVLWRVDGADISGTDRTHVQTVVGASVVLPPGVTLCADWSFFGERAIWVGLGYALPSGGAEEPEEVPVASLLDP